MSYTPKTVVLVDWPHSQRIMGHPEAMAVDCDSDGDSSYVVPVEVWEQWKGGYYVAEDDEDEEDVDEEECDVASETIDARKAVAMSFAAARRVGPHAVLRAAVRAARDDDAHEGQRHGEDMRDVMRAAEYSRYLDARADAEEEAEVKSTSCASKIQDYIDQNLNYCRYCANCY